MMVLIHCTALVVALITIATYPGGVHGHGRLMDPPSRSSLWRYPNFRGRAPTNYDDNALYCGGFNHQWNEMGGRCGICGDAFDANPRPNEPPHGKYAVGLISRHLTEGQVYNASVQITAYHKGWFEFRICPNNDVERPATQACLDRYPLRVAGTQDTRYSIDVAGRRGALTHTIPLVMPPGLICSQCVLQWKYHAGNSWGRDPGGRGCVGCGPQEEFYGCADISIAPGGGVPATHTPSPRPPPKVTNAPTATPNITTATRAPTPTLQCRGANKFAASKGMAEWCVNNCKLGYCPPSRCVCDGLSPPTPSPTSEQPGRVTQPAATSETTTGAATETRCRAVGAWSGDVNMDTWCVNNCARGFCPKENCACGADPSPTIADPYASCVGVGANARKSNIAAWCRDNCSKGYCPSSYCRCPGAGGGGRPDPYASCRAAGAFVNTPGITEWCRENCSVGYCPGTLCSC